MTDSRLLGFLSGRPSNTVTPSRSDWSKAAPPINQTVSPNPRSVASTATLPAQPFLHSAVESSSRELFKALAEEWHRETAGHSSMTMRQRHPAYARIVGLGSVAVPMLLVALRDTPDHWFSLLRDITKQNPVHPDDRGDYLKMSGAWLAWGQEKGLIP